MAATRIALLKTGIITDLGTISLLVTAAGVIGALCWYWAVRGTPFRFLFERPAWARLKPARRRPCSRRNNSQRRRRRIDSERLTAHIRAMPATSKSKPKAAAKPAAAKAAPQVRRRRRLAQKGRPRLPGRRLGLHLPRLPRAAAADPQVRRPADQRRARLLQHAVEAAQRDEAGGAADASRGGVRQVGKDLPHRFLSGIQGAPAGRRPTISSRSSR